MHLVLIEKRKKDEGRRPIEIEIYPFCGLIFRGNDSFNVVPQ